VVSWSTQSLWDTHGIGTRAHTHRDCLEIRTYVELLRFSSVYMTLFYSHEH
jgi:hypothetical protein